MKNLILVFCLLAFINRVQAQKANEPDIYKTVLPKFIKFYNASAADSIQQLYDAEMQKASPPDKTRQLVTELQSQLGKLQSAVPIEGDERSVMYKATFLKGDVSMLMIVDPKGKIKGLFFQPYMENKVVKSASPQQVTLEDYQNTLDRFMRFYNNSQPDSLLMLFSNKIVKKEELNPDKMKQVIEGLGKQFGKYQRSAVYNTLYPEIQYKVKFEKGMYLGKLKLDSVKKIETIFFEPFKNKDVSLGAGLTETPETLSVDKGTLYGSLILPQKISGKMLLIIVIAGSGPTDRYGNNVLGVDAWSYRYLSNELGKSGIATLLYDKRMVGKSQTGQKEENLHFADYINDAAAWAKKFTADKRFSSVIFAGHSEGGLIGIMAAEKTPVKGLITIAGIGRPLKDDMREQLTDKDHPEYIRKLDSLSKGMNVHAAVDDPVFRPSVQPFFIEVLKIDPAAEMRKLNIPVLITQGTTDLQVKIKDAERLKSAAKKGTLKIIPGMNHVMKAAPAEPEKNNETYRNPQLPIKPELVTAISTFCISLK